MTGERRRLDRLLVEKGLAESRSKAADLIRAGRVTVDGQPQHKPAAMVGEEAVVAVAGDEPQYVSRSALKLRHALDHFALSVAGSVALDIGASTGGFTEVLLERGAARVYAVDVGRDQLHPRLADDPRVVALEATDARTLDRKLVPQPVDILVADVSFISLTRVLLQPLSLLRAGGQLVALIKPQFEVGRQLVGKGGIVKDGPAVADALARIEALVAAQPGWQVLGVIASPIRGREGNQEYLLAAISAGDAAPAEPLGEI